MWASVGFVYRPVVILPAWSLYTVTSRKLTCVSLMSTVNLMVWWTSFKALMKEYNSSLGCGHIKDISSMYLHQTNGVAVCLFKNLSSNWPMKMMA